MDAKDSSNDDGKENGSNNDNSNNENERLLSSPPESPTLATRYAHRVATLVRSIVGQIYQAKRIVNNIT